MFHDSQNGEPIPFRDTRCCPRAALNIGASPAASASTVRGWPTSVDRARAAHRFDAPAHVDINGDRAHLGLLHGLKVRNPTPKQFFCCNA
jgi:hypothetical protein